MALWLFRAGSHGEYEQRFLTEGRIYLTWSGLKHDLGAVKNKEDLRRLLERIYPTKPKAWISFALGQTWAFSHSIKTGDWLALPSKLKRACIHIAECTGPYVFDAEAEEPFYHYRFVKWFAQDTPRSSFDSDILLSLGAQSPIAHITRNNAEERIRAMAKAGWEPRAAVRPPSDDNGAEEEGLDDLEQTARDQIAKLIQAKFQQHGLARLVNAILEAQGYVTYLSPPGPDKGVDILAAPAPMGFGQPRLCVQVKSGASPLDRPTLDQLIGAMQNVQAQQGLLVSWGGFRSSIDRERATQFFKVRLWDQDDLIEQLLTHYEKLDDDIRAELPLKRIWTIALTEDVVESRLDSSGVPCDDAD